MSFAALNRSAIPLIGALAFVGGGCAGDPADPVVCPAPAVEIDEFGATWCAHHDVARFTCPAELPERAVFNDVAICGAVQPDRETGLDVARAALRTGRVFERRAILAFEVPSAWQTAPGAAVGERLDVPTVTFSDDDVSWVSADGDARLCTVRFDHFETEPADDGRTLNVTAWDRVRCGPDEVGTGAEIRETHPLSLAALPAGRYTLASPPAFTGRAPSPAPLVVGLDGICPAPRPIEACFRGAFFAECGAAADLEPGIWCEGGASVSCVWSACPPAGYSAVDCRGDGFCPNPHEGWGTEPWDRTRAMVVSVEVDDDLEAGAPSVACAVGSSDVAPERVCGPGDATWTTRRSPHMENARWGWPSLVRLRTSHLGESALEGWDLSVELDVFAEGGPRARACLVHSSDGGAAGAPVCASGGVLTVDRLPDGPEAVDGMAAELSVEFPDFATQPDCESPCMVRGLEVQARL